MSKPFFYRITAADFLAAVVTVPAKQRGQWVLDLALDMVSGDKDAAKSAFAKAIIVEAAEFSGKKRDAANKRWNAKQMQTDAVHIHSNARSSNSTEAVTEKKEQPLVTQSKFDDEDLRFAEWMFKKIESLGGNHKTPNFNDWANTIRLMRERDDLSLKAIGQIFLWANNDDFWSSNILSPKTLRKQFSQLSAKALKPQPQGNDRKTFQQMKTDATQQAMIDFVTEDNDDGFGENTIRQIDG